MYLLISNNQYPVDRRRVNSQSVIYSGLESEPTDISGTIQMFRDDGFLMSEDTVQDYLRYTYSGGILTLTNIPEPEPQPEPEPGPYIPTDHDVLNALLGIGGDTE